MKLADTHYDNSETGCCARLDVDRWDRKEVRWTDKAFVRAPVRTFMYVPLNFGGVMRKVADQIESAQAYPEDPLWLSEEVSPWQTDLLVAVDGDVPGASMTRLSGTFLTRVFDGPYSHAGRWLREMKAHVAEQGRVASKTLTYYAACPKCAKRFGHNHVVLLAQVE